MNAIDLWNNGITSAVNKDDETYQAWVGVEDFTPESEIVESDDFNCGAICNELEFVRVVSDYYVSALDIENADNGELEDMVNTFIDLQRDTSFEVDARYKNRFRFIAVQKTNPRRTTRWSILDAVSYFIPDLSTVQLIEFFDTKNLYFDLRIEGPTTIEDGMYVDLGFIDFNYIQGQGVGAVTNYIGGLVQRIKAAGVDFDVTFVDQNSSDLSSGCIIGSVRKTLLADYWVQHINSLTLLTNAEVLGSGPSFYNADCELTDYPTIEGPFTPRIYRCTWARDGSFARSGVYSFKFTDTGGLGDPTVSLTSNDFYYPQLSMGSGSDMSGFNANSTFTVSVWAQNNITKPGPTITLEARYCTGNDTGTTTVIDTDAVSMQNSWQQLSVSGTIPSNATGVSIGFAIAGTSSIAQKPVWFDDFEVGS